MDMLEGSQGPIRDAGKEKDGVGRFEFEAGECQGSKDSDKSRRAALRSGEHEHIIIVSFNKSVYGTSSCLGYLRTPISP